MVFTENFYVGYSDTNCNLQLSNTAILKFFENIASMHGTAAQDGIKASPHRWFLTAYQVKVHHRPEYEERIGVRTWSRELRGFSSCREFEIYDSQDRLAVTGISNWARINIETGAPEKISAERYALYESEPERTNFNVKWVGRIKESQEYAFEKSFYIDRNFIDANRHMNNVYYLDLADCILPDDVYDRVEINEFEIAYRKAIAYGETVKCCYAETDENYIIAIKSEDCAQSRAIIRYAKC